MRYSDMEKEKKTWAMCRPCLFNHILDGYRVSNEKDHDQE